MYLEGPLFTPYKRDFIDMLAVRLRERGISVFVPHDEVTDFRLRRSMAGDVRLSLFLRGCIEQRGSVHIDVDAALDEVDRPLG